MMARLEGFEPPAYGLEGRCSIQLSYRRVGPIVARPALAWSPTVNRSSRLPQDRASRLAGSGEKSVKSTKNPLASQSAPAAEGLQARSFSSRTRSEVASSHSS